MVDDYSFHGSTMYCDGGACVYVHESKTCPNDFSTRGLHCSVNSRVTRGWGEIIGTSFTLMHIYARTPITVHCATMETVVIHHNYFDLQQLKNE